MAHGLVRNVSLALLMALTADAVRADPLGVGAALAQAAGAFLASLDAGQRARAQIAFNSPDRLDWAYVPRQRGGLSLKGMTEPQRKAAFDLLRASLGEKGFRKAETIVRLEDVLRAMGGGAMRDRELYYFSVFGEPAARGSWGWRLEGHHLSLNWTVVNGTLAGSTPQFFGADPADVGDGPLKGTRALAAEEDLGRALVRSLNESQRAQAVLESGAPSDIVTGNQREAALQEDKGIAYGQLDAAQQGALLSLLQEYADAQPVPVARARLDTIRRAGLERVKFAWMGGLQKGEGHYYRIQGPTFLIEYDNTQRNANHIHTVWRDFKGDWGKDALAEHYLSAPHHADARERAKETPRAKAQAPR
jgi:uncharacterized protein DUF3500